MTAASLLPTICHLVEASGNKFVLHFVLGISLGGCLLDTFILSLDHWEGKGVISIFLSASWQRWVLVGFVTTLSK